MRCGGAREGMHRRIVVDFGGPGSAVLSDATGLDRLVDTARGLAGRFNWLVVEEPWVTTDSSRVCEQGLERFYASVRASSRDEEAAPELARVCAFSRRPAQWGFEASSYARLITEIAAREQLSLVGFIGHSWGSVRLQYLSDSNAVRFEWAVLLRPFPVGRSLGSLLGDRVRIMAAESGSIRLLRRVQPSPQGRLVTRFDQLSAIAALGYVDDDYFERVSRGVRDGSDQSRIAQLSDQMWRRPKNGAPARSLLAYFQEVCGFAGAVPHPPLAVRRLPDLVRVLHAPCGTFAKNRSVTAVVPPATCVVVGTQDAVTPERLVRAAYGRLHVAFVTSAVRSHSSFDGLNQCLTQIDVGSTQPVEGTP